MSSEHRINIVVPSRSYIQKVKRIAKEEKMSVSELFRHAIIIFELNSSVKIK